MIFLLCFLDSALSKTYIRVQFGVFLSSRKIKYHFLLFLGKKSAPLLCICKLNRYRHISVRVGPPIPQTCLKACKIGNLALILRNPRHENRRFSESEGMGYYVSRFHFAETGTKNMPTNADKMPPNSCLGFHKVHYNQSDGCKFQRLTFHLHFN